MRFAKQSFETMWRIVVGGIDTTVRHRDIDQDGAHPEVSDYRREGNTNPRSGDPFSPDDYIFELKMDGFRALAYVGEHETRQLSRRSNC